jgi:hypothetical protein
MCIIYVYIYKLYVYILFSNKGQVWNQGVYGFNVKSKEVIKSAAKACEWLGGCKTVGKYNWNPKAVQWVGISSTIQWVSEAYPSRNPRTKDAHQFISSNTYSYLLELDNNGNIIGGEWKFNKHPTFTSHPDFLW